MALPGTPRVLRESAADVRQPAGPLPERAPIGVSLLTWGVLGALAWACVAIVVQAF